MELLYFDSVGLSIFQTPTGDIYLHHVLQNILIGPLPNPDDAFGIAEANGWRH